VCPLDMSVSLDSTDSIQKKKFGFGRRRRLSSQWNVSLNYVNVFLRLQIVVDSYNFICSFDLEKTYGFEESKKLLVQKNYIGIFQTQTRYRITSEYISRNKIFITLILVVLIFPML
jgi:hypothetical protein